MPSTNRLFIQVLAIAGVVCSTTVGAQSTSNSVAISRPRPAALQDIPVTGSEAQPNIAPRQRLHLNTPRFSSEAAFPLPLPDPHDGNYARRGAFIGALTTGVASAVIVGLFAKRDCEPGLCGSEFQRGALVGGGVGLAAGAVLGWLIGAEIARPAPMTPPD